MPFAAALLGRAAHWRSDQPQANGCAVGAKLSAYPWRQGQEGPHHTALAEATGEPQGLLQEVQPWRVAV